MNISEYARMDAVALADLVRTKQITAAKLARLDAGAVKSLNPELNALIALHEDRIERLSSADQQPGVLSGVPSSTRT